MIIPYVLGMDSGAEVAIKSGTCTHIYIYRYTEMPTRCRLPRWFPHSIRFTPHQGSSSQHSYNPHLSYRSPPPSDLHTHLLSILLHPLLHPRPRLSRYLRDSLLVLERLLDGMRSGDVAAAFERGTSGLRKSVLVHTW